MFVCEDPIIDRPVPRGLRQGALKRSHVDREWLGIALLRSQSLEVSPCLRDLFPGCGPPILEFSGLTREAADQSGPPDGGSQGDHSLPTDIHRASEQLFDPAVELSDFRFSARQIFQGLGDALDLLVDGFDSFPLCDQFRGEAESTPRRLLSCDFCGRSPLRFPRRLS